MRKKQKKKKKQIVPVRMNLLFFFVFALFSVLILRLGVVQIVHGEQYEEQVNRKDVTAVAYSVPRGEMYDRNYKLVKYNVPEKAIVFTPPKNPQPAELLDLAKKLAELITMSEDDMKKVTERDLKDLWLLENDNGKDLLTDEEITRWKNKEISDKKLYQIKLARITEEQMREVDTNIAAIYRKLYSAVALTPSIVKNKDVTDEEYARVSENLVNLPGIDITTDWRRERVYDDVFWNILGGVSDSDKGIPAEKVDEYLAKGYKLNDRVGTSYLEEVYDDILQGQKSKMKTVTNKNGDVVATEVLSEGKSGKDLILTIDIDLQMQVEMIIEEELAKGMKTSSTLDRAFIVAMDPMTGEILAMSGRQYNPEAKEFIDFTPGTFTTSYATGSVVKGATVLTGFQTGSTYPGERKLDEVMVIRGSGSFSSHQVMGWVDDLTALERSSNVYMWKIAIDILGGKYSRGQSLRIEPENIEIIRKYFGQFGLGVPTGIDFENEIAGIKGTDPSSYFQIAIGQLDTYTPLQLAQYVSTIANGGYRLKPQLVKEIREPNLDSDEPGRLIKKFEPVVLNRIDMKDEWIKRVQEGFWRVTHGSRGTARHYFRNEPYNAAGKTGTAEAYLNGMETYNLSFVGYAPYEDPEIAISVMVPNAYRKGGQPNSLANVLAQRVFRAYFALKEERLENGENHDGKEVQTEEVSGTSLDSNEE